jgi:ABC-type nitrate/sulfonate/bicarbonate transport system substrate-binding protein
MHRIGIPLMALAAAAILAGEAAAQAPCAGPMRKINVGVAVSPPNVVHTSPYVAKALGYFRKRCIDVNIIQFDGGASPAAMAAVSQGTAISALADAAIAQGMKARQIWGYAPRAPQDYVVSEGIKTPADLKGKRLSAAGGIGAFNWLVGRDILKLAGLSPDDVQFVSQGTAGRLPGLVAGQIDGVALHPEDVYIARQKKPGAHSLVKLAELWPNFVFNSYGAAQSLIDREPDLLRDTIAAMIEANRTIYRDKEKVVPIMVEATQKPRDAVEYAWDYLTKQCIWSVNTGFDPARTAWTVQFGIDSGDIDPAKKPGYDQIVDAKLAKDAVAALGGPTAIGNCKD